MRKKSNIDAIIKDAKHVLISDIPKDVNRLIQNEQNRLDMHENQRLKKPAVVCRMLREWYRLKTIEVELLNQQKQIK